MGIAALLRGKRQPIDRFICAWAGCDDPAFLCLCSGNKKPPAKAGAAKTISEREPESGSHHLEQLLVACTGFLIGESRLHIEFNAEHRAPGSEVLEQNHAAFRFADHYATACLRAVRATDQLEAVNVITFSPASHVLNQLGVSSLLPFDLGELPSDVVELHLFLKVTPPPSTRTVNTLQRRSPQPASGAHSLQRFVRC